MNKDDKQTIYEIYRACRLCGAGAGYKMPIIQSVIDLEGEDIELKQKIKDCVQIEVNHNDRMPPLICELCVDKINDFFEFRKMCQDTNKNTRLRLGLPLELPVPILPKLEINDSIIGMSEPVYIYSDSDEGEPLSKQQSAPTPKSKPKPKSAKLKKESKLKVDNAQPFVNKKFHSPSPEPERRETTRKRPPSPKRSSRRRNSDDLSELRTNQMDEMSLLVPRSKRPREVHLELPPPFKKARPAPVPPIPENISKPGPKSSKIAQKAAAPQKEAKPPPRAGPKSRTQSISPAPTPKAKKAEMTPSTALKSKKKEASPAPAPKFSKELANLLGQATKPKKVDITQAPGPKSKKAEITLAPGPKSKKAEITPAPGPKSKKAEITLAPGPKSKKAEIMPAPGPKSKKAEIMPAPGPKSKKVELNSTPELKKDEVTHKPGPKSRRREISPATTSKSKKSSREQSPSPSRSKKREPSPQTPSRASPVPTKSTVCNICGWKAKTPQGFVSHLKSHTPSFTAIRLSCNACELWFYTSDEAIWHHRRHANKSLPYTCNKCYDDFRTADDYEMHFTRNQCLPTYEVPDVKCDDCWRYFATYKLLEDHKCPGEGGRPGGQCSKCNKTYSLLKHQIVHEMKCNVKKKGEPIVDPEVHSKLLPMEVRIVKCDLLLKNPVNERYDVSKLSNTFGLDRKCTYPYLNSAKDARVKSEPSTNRFDHMVSIQDDIKEEYLKDDDSYVHWDSDGSSDSGDTMDSVDSLSKMSLKTIFSPKYLGKVPRKKRKIKSEGTCESPLSVDFNGSLGTNIDNIITNLENETVASVKCNSDSVVNKSTDSSPTIDVLDSLKTDETVSRKDENKNKDDPVKESDETDSDKIRNNVETKNDENETKITTDSNTNLDEATNSDSLVQSDDTAAHQSTNTDYKLISDSKNGHLVDNNIVNDKVSLHEEDKVDLNLSIETGKVEVDDKLKKSDVINDKEVNTTEIISNLHNVSGDLNKESVLSNDNNEIDANSENSQSSDVIDFKAIDITNEVKEGSQSSVVTNDKTDSDFTNIDSDNTTDSQLSVTKSCTIEKLDDKQDEPATKGIGFQDSAVTGNDSVEKDVQCADKFNINNLNDDDKRLMADLDAHIGENESNRNDDKVIQGGVIGANVTNEQSEHSTPVTGDSNSAVLETNSTSAVKSDVGFDNCEEKKESLEDMMQKRDADLRSLDLDSISDEEFNFDI